MCDFIKKNSHYQHYLHYYIQGGRQKILTFRNITYITYITYILRVCDFIKKIHITNITYITTFREEAKETNIL